MVQVGGGRDLAQKALWAEGVDQLRPENFHGYLALVLEIVREVDRGHPARTELALKTVAVGEVPLKSGLEVRQLVATRRVPKHDLAGAWSPVGQP